RSFGVSVDQVPDPLLGKSTNECVTVALRDLGDREARCYGRRKPLGVSTSDDVEEFAAISRRLWAEFIKNQDRGIRCARDEATLASAEPVTLHFPDDFRSRGPEQPREPAKLLLCRAVPWVGQNGPLRLIPPQACC